MAAWNGSKVWVTRPSHAGRLTWEMPVVAATDAVLHRIFHRRWNGDHSLPAASGIGANTLGVADEFMDHLAQRAVWRAVVRKMQAWCRALGFDLWPLDGTVAWARSSMLDLATWMRFCNPRAS